MGLGIRGQRSSGSGRLRTLVSLAGLGLALTSTAGPATGVALALTAGPATGSGLQASGSQVFVGKTSQKLGISLSVQNLVAQQLTKVDVRDRCPGGPVSHDVFSFNASKAIRLPPKGSFIGTGTRRSGHRGITTIHLSGSFVQMAFSGSFTVTRYASSTTPAACTSGPVTFSATARQTPVTPPVTPIGPGSFAGHPTVSAPFLINYGSNAINNRAWLPATRR